MQAPDEFDPPVGVAMDLGHDVRRIVAPNPSPMTYRGTNTYLLGQRGLAVIDPGPNDDAHLEAILAAVEPGQSISHILVTHAHVDHSPLAKRLAGITGAPVLAYGGAKAGQSPNMAALEAAGLSGGGEGVDWDFAPDHVLADGAVVTGDGWEVTSIWTPGHMSNHMCFDTGEVLFCGDHVMGWASSLVSPPDGDLQAFMVSCARLRALPERLYHPGHGAPITAAHDRLDWLMAHRQGREDQLRAALTDSGQSVSELTRGIYTEVDARLLPAAERNVFAHLIDLHERGLVTALPELSPDAEFRVM